MKISELYRSAIRTVTVVFGSLFNNIYVRKYDSKGIELPDKRKVEIIFSDKTNYAEWLENTMRRPDDGTKIGIRFPRLSYDLTGFTPDEQRQLNPLLCKHGSVFRNNTDIPYSNKLNSPAAYNFNFTLSLWSNDMDSSIQVLEQILPYFKPEVAVKIVEQPDLPIANDMIITFNGITKNDNYMEGLEVNRIIQWDMEFSVYANIWTHNTDSSGVINEVIVDLNNLCSKNGNIDLAMPYGDNREYFKR